MLKTLQLYVYRKIKNVGQMKLKGIVSQDIGRLQMILMDRIVVPDVPLEVYLFLKFRFHIVLLLKSFED